MGQILVKDKSIAVPGEILAEGMDFLPAGGVFRENDKIIASQVGIVNIDNRLVKLIPLNGRYNPKRGDMVIGDVVNITFNGWVIDIGCTNFAVLPLRDAKSDFIDKGDDLSRYYGFKDIVVAKISNVSKTNMIDLTMKGPGLMKLKGGMMIDVTPSKVPRVIGKQGSMISLLKERTGCKIIVGQNGKVWIKGENFENEKKAVDAIKMIEEFAHTAGLTDRISGFLGGSGDGSNRSE